jgi:DNA-binding transcriptional MerR regulator
MKRAGGRRFYRPQDLLVLKGVRALLHDDGYTIKGVQRLHKEQGVKRLLAAGQGAAGSGPLSGMAPEFDEGVLDQGAETALEAHMSTPKDAGSEQRLRDALAALEAAKARLSRALSGS